MLEELFTQWGPTGGVSAFAVWVFIRYERLGKRSERFWESRLAQMRTEDAEVRAQYKADLAEYRDWATTEITSLRVDLEECRADCALERERSRELAARISQLEADT